ncbi:MAG TPA: hypothetical protein VMT61_10785, partial [Candidatus Binataceae bacterium]|nr:hypothetical protein [Candidatus Binataceae bacterium]
PPPRLYLGHRDTLKPGLRMSYVARLAYPEARAIEGSARCDRTTHSPQSRSSGVLSRRHNNSVPE